MSRDGLPGRSAGGQPLYGEERPWRPSVSPWIIAWTVMLATFMEVLDTSVANVALPHIAGSLSAGLDESAWVLTSYLVSNAIVLPLSGWFSMILGRRRFYITCVALFTVSSLMCGLAPNLAALIVSRVFQGVGGGALQPMSQAILLESFPREKRGMAMAFYGLGVVFAPIIGPTLGGWITDNFSWRWVFLINLPVGALSITLTLLLVEDPPYLIRKRLRNVRIDYAGLAFLALGLGFLEVMLDKGQREDWFNSWLIVTAAVIAAVSLLAMVFWELRCEEPVIELRLLKERNFMLVTSTMFVLGSVLYGSTMLLPLFLQTLLGYTALTSGLALSPGGLVVACMMPLVGWLLTRYEPRWLILAGISLTAAGLYRMSHFNLQIDFRTAVLARTVQSAGLAFLFVPLNTAAFAFTPKEKTNNATGFINLARNIGGSTGIALATTLLARRAQFHQHVLVGRLTPFDEAYRSMLDNAARMFVQKGASAYQAAQMAYGALYAAVRREASMLAFNDAFLLMAGAFLALIPLILILKNVKPGKAQPPPR